MKRALIIGLVVVNVLLLAALTLAPDPPKAYGQQSLYGGTDYLMMTARYENSYDVLYAIDLHKRKMCYFLFDRTAKQMVSYGQRQLKTDFPPID